MIRHRQPRQPRRAIARPPHGLGLALLAAAALAACGGSNDDGDPVTPTQQAARIEGTAALGAALAQARVSLTAAGGAAACTEAEIQTDDQGRFACTLAEGAEAPFLLVVTDDQGGTTPLVSVGLATPGADEVAVLNATPLTTAIVGQLATDDNPLAIVDDPSMIDGDVLVDVTAKVLTQLRPVLAALGAGPKFDPFTTPLVAATPESAGNVADAVLESLRFSQLGGQTVVATVDRPDLAVPLADAGTVSPPKLPEPGTDAGDLGEGMRRLAAALNSCFAQPLAERVLAKDEQIEAVDGGPEVTETGDGCEGIVADDYLGNGRRPGQAYYGLLTDAGMDSARFDVPTVVQVLPDETGAGADRAIVNLTYRRSAGSKGNVFDLAQRLTEDQPGVGAAGDWVLVGNQQRVHASISAVTIRREQLAPDAGFGVGPFGNAANSRFEVGLSVYVNKDGPGSTGLRAVRVKGPGMPTAGLVMTRLAPTVCSDQDWMNVRRKDGLTDPLSASFAGNGGNRLVLQRTMGLTGTDATTRRPNPYESGTNNTQYVNYAHPLDYGQPPGSTDYVDFTKIPALSVYSFEFFYEGETTPRYTYPKTLVTSVTPAVEAYKQRWQVLDDATRRLLDPADALAAATTSMTLSWTPDPLAAPVQSLGVYTGTVAGGAVNQGQVVPAPGGSTAVAEAPSSGTCGTSASFPALTADAQSWRTLQMRMRRLDGSQQDSFMQFN